MAGKKTAEFMIVNRRSGKALQATGLDNGLVVEQAEPAKTDAQTWTSLETEGGVKFFNKACGKVLDVMANGTANGTWVQTWEDVDGESQLWKLVTVSPTYKKIVNVMADKALDIVDMSDEDGAPAQIWESVDGEGQQWKFVSTAPKAATKTVRKPAAKKAAQEKQVVFLDLYSAFADENGALHYDASNDGVHLSKAYCQQWLTYLQTHTVDPEALAAGREAAPADLGGSEEETP